jgi:hypothetical protein
VRLRHSRAHRRGGRDRACLTLSNEEVISSGLILIAEGEEGRTPAALVERTNSQAVDPATVVVIEVGGPLALDPRLTGFVPCLTDDGVLVR